jgi:hypothetical protein
MYNAPMVTRLDLKNKKILNFLTELEQKVIASNITAEPRGWDGINYDTVCHDNLSDEFLENIIDQPDSLYKKPLSYTNIVDDTPAGQFFLENIGSMLDPEIHYTASYVPRGFVGWHTDFDAAGHYLMFVYSPHGTGFFKVRNKDGSISTVPDKKGWELRYFNVADHVHTWHCAGAPDSRVCFFLGYHTQERFNHALSIVTSQ